MSNVIAVIWDFDKTLIKEYMEEPIFREYGIKSKDFWNETNALPKKYMEEQGVRVNPDTIYLNQILKYVREGKFKGLSNEKLRTYGNSLEYYPGVPEVFPKLQEVIKNNATYALHDIKLEHYVVSTGLTEIIKGSRVMQYISGVWGCEFIESTTDTGERVISEIGYTIDNTTKTRALFEINKGVGKVQGITVNVSIPEEHRRVHFINMIYVADGPSDIPAFSLINHNHGATFAIYPKGDMKALKQVEQMREDGRVQMFAEADYSEEATAYMWLRNKIEEIADRICAEEKKKIEKYTQSKVPQHLI